MVCSVAWFEVLPCPRQGYVQRMECRAAPGRRPRANGLAGPTSCPGPGSWRGPGCVPVPVGRRPAWPAPAGWSCHPAGPSRRRLAVWSSASYAIFPTGWSPGDIAAGTAAIRMPASPCLAARCAGCPQPRAVVLRRRHGAGWRRAHTGRERVRCLASARGPCLAAAAPHGNQVEHGTSSGLHGVARCRVCRTQSGRLFCRGHQVRSAPVRGRNGRTAPLAHIRIRRLARHDRTRADAVAAGDVAQACAVRAAAMSPMRSSVPAVAYVRPAFLQTARSDAETIARAPPPERIAKKPQRVVSVAPARVHH